MTRMFVTFFISSLVLASSAVADDFEVELVTTELEPVVEAKEVGCENFNKSPAPVKVNQIIGIYKGEDITGIGGKKYPSTKLRLAYDVRSTDGRWIEEALAKVYYDNGTPGGVYCFTAVIASHDQRTFSINNAGEEVKGLGPLARLLQKPEHARSIMGATIFLRSAYD